MKLEPNELTGNGYQLMAELNHKELIPFVQEYIKKPTRIVYAYYLITIVFAILLVSLVGYAYYIDNESFKTSFLRISHGLGISLLLIPIHEYIHALAYKKVGAQHTSYDANWKKLYFMAVADKFVANRREFRIVALAPIVVISALLLLAIPILPLHWKITASSTLLMHASFCAGDFGLLSYFDFHRDIDLVTYDDKEAKVSYFYGKKSI